MFETMRRKLQAITQKPVVDAQPKPVEAVGILSNAPTLDLDIAPGDPILALFLSAPGVIEVEKLDMNSPTLRKLKEANVKIAVPLVSQGELIGVLNLGSRMSEQDYSTDDRRLLNTLATQAAPSLRVAQLVRQQEIEARERERLEQELRVARIIQQTLLPKNLPDLPGWQVAAHWQPARAVSGDFYDFIFFPDGKLGLITGDVTDKGVPAALVMATTRSVLRSVSERYDAPGEILSRANDLLCPDMPPNMFITCLYLVLDPATGQVRFANAGHNLPCQVGSNGVVERRATGMPLGLMPGMVYEENEINLEAGEVLLMYSDGLVEAHNPMGEMFGFPRLRQLLAQPFLSASSYDPIHMIPYLLEELRLFTGDGWEQEDDVTFLLLEHKDEPKPIHANEGGQTFELLADISLPSEPGNEVQAMALVEDAVRDLALPEAKLSRLKTAVAETTMNAIEHGNRYNADLPVDIQVLASEQAVLVRITDHGGGQSIPEPETPDLEAKLAGLQSPRGWGLFLIKNMVDDMKVTVSEVEGGEPHHTVELTFNRKGADDGQPAF